MLQIMYKLFKRFIDFIFSLVLLILLSPVMLIVAIAIKLDSKGPILFKQERSGKNDSVFKMYKFRSMVASNDVMNFKEEDKITRVGKILRKTSLDEIPQLFNILKGEMSFIGPRPWILEYRKYFTKQQKRRLEVLPGLTGLAQCEGRNGISVFEKINYDIKYVDNLSLRMDLYVIFKTFYIVFTAKGAVGNKNIIKNELEDLKGQFKNKNKLKRVMNGKYDSLADANGDSLNSDSVRYAESVI